jgi:hypothetical protein
MKPYDEVLADAKKMVRDCLGHFGQEEDDATIERVARKIVAGLPKFCRPQPPASIERE